mmetsp:Transcript_17548/g.50032  ORF Transcript_17548/g.50032 Transcript_17548/m.50032 type:complete len:180 (-) Transcript_17548:351-890(-)
MGFCASKSAAAVPAAAAAPAPTAAPADTGAGVGPTLVNSRPEGKKASAEPGAEAAVPVEPTREAPQEEVATADAPASSVEGEASAPSGKSSDERAAEPAAQGTTKPGEEVTAATSPKAVPEDAAAASAASTASTTRSAAEESRADSPDVEAKAVPTEGGKTEAQKMPFFAACCGQSAWC